MILLNTYIYIQLSWIYILLPYIVYQINHAYSILPFKTFPGIPGDFDLNFPPVFSLLIMCVNRVERRICDKYHITIIEIKTNGMLNKS